MKFIKNVFLSVAVFAFTLALVGAFSSNKAYALTCTAIATGNWTNTTTWDAGCNTDTIPAAIDDIVIPGNFIVTVNTAGVVANTISLSNPIALGNNGITIAAPGTLAVTGNVTIVGSSGASNSTVAVADGTLSAANISITGGGSTGNSVVSVSTGTITVSADIINLGVALRGQLTSTAASNINVGGNFTGGTFTGTGGTVTYNGSGAQTVGIYTTYNNLVINKSAGTATLAGATTVGGNLTVTAGTLATAGEIFTVTGATSIASGGTLSFTTGAKTFTGNVTNAGTWSETGASTYTFGGSLANTGTFTASTGVHAFNAAGTHALSGTLVIPSLDVEGAGVVTNNGTLTVSTALSTGGSGGFTQGATGVLNIGMVTVGVGLNATAVGNVVNYYRAGPQTVKSSVGYFDLTLSGTGEKTIGSGQTVSHTISVGTGASTGLTGNTTTNYLRFAGFLKKKGSWGFTGSGATHIDAVFMTAGGGRITASDGPSSSVPSVSTTTTINDNSGSSSSNTNEDTPATTPAPTPTPTVVPGCSGGNQYNTSTGALCMSAVAAAAIEGCANRTTGFSNTTGKSCVGNVVSAAATTKTYDFGTVTLKNGSKGAAVMELQKFLNAKLNLGLVVDGKLGPKTIAVIKKWQSDNGLVADGLIGAKTKAKMNASL